MTPTFSVIIPTWNRPQSLLACLNSFRRLDYPPGAWELIVVNDGGASSFSAVTGDLKQSLPLQMVTVDHNGPAAARNAGARRAQGDFLAFTDDDCRVSPGWLSAFAAGFADGYWHALGGRSLTPFAQNPAERAWQQLTDFLNTFMQDDDGNALLLLSNNVAYRRDVFARSGGFNEGFPLAAAEDMELSCRLLAAGYRQRIIAEATVLHYHHLTAWGHIRQQFRYGRGGHYFNQILSSETHNKLRSLYLHEAFYPSLRNFVRRQELPLWVKCLIACGQTAYRIGLRYQALLSRLKLEPGLHQELT